MVLLSFDTATPHVTVALHDGERVVATYDADRAMRWLHKAVQAGWKDAAHMKQDTDLDSLRERQDFKKLLESLPKPKEPAPPPRKKP